MFKSKNNSIIYNLLALAFGCLFGYFLNITGYTWVVSIFITPFGTLYLRLLSFVALPMMFSLMLASIISFTDIRKIISLSLESIFANLASAIGVGVISCAVTIFFVAHKYLSLPALASTSQIHTVKLSNYMDNLMNIVQSNVTGRFLQQNLMIIFVVSVFVGVLVATNRKKLEYLADFSSSLNPILKHMLDIVMRFAPIGVFALTTDAFASNDLAVLGSLLGLITLVCLITVITIVLSIFLTSYLSKKSFLFSLKAQAPTIFFGFATASSTACLPLSQEGAEGLGCDKETSAFVIPLVKMLIKPGYVVMTYCSIAFILISKGGVLSLSTWCYMILISIIFSIMAPAIPMGGVFIIPPALAFMGREAPESLVRVLFAIYVFIDMFITSINCSLDVFFAVAVDKFEKRKKKPHQAIPFGVKAQS